MIRKPMLAAKTPEGFTFDAIKFPVLASPKLDGVRALVVNGVVMSRKMLPIPNKHVQKLFGKAKYNGLDGELVVGYPTDSDCYRQTMSGVMSIEGEPAVTFWIFDNFKAMGGFRDRYHTTKVLACLDANLEVVLHLLCNDENYLTELEERWLRAGYEGAMIRSIDGPYKQGRATIREGYLTKIKRFEDGEAVVIGAKEQFHNENETKIGEVGQTKRSTKRAGLKAGGKLGAFVVRDCKTGIEFDCGTGFTDAERRECWGPGGMHCAGLIIKYRYFPSGSKEKPRFPTFLGFRDPIDF